MFARMTRWEFETSPEQVDTIIQNNRDRVMPAASALPGFKGFYSFIDREHGRSVTLTLWESEDAARISDEMANRLRAGTSQKTGITMVGTERYEVVVRGDDVHAQATGVPASVGS